jgi:ketosteroid isomerase-like protein
MKPFARYAIRCFVMILVVTLAACQPKNSVDLADAARTAIRKTLDEGMPMFQNLNKENAAVFVKFLYADDVIIFPPNAPPLTGHEAITGMLQNYPPVPDYKQESEEIEVFGDYAYLRDTWSVTMNPPGMTAYKDTGTVIQIWKKQADGSWKLWREIWHSDLRKPTSTRESMP